MAKKSRKVQKKRSCVTSEVVELVNLRPEEGENGEIFFTPVKPAGLVDDEGWEPVGSIGGTTVFAGERSMKAGDKEYELGGRVRGIIEGADGSIMVDDGSGRVSRFEHGADGEPVAIGPEPEWNPVTITAVRHSVVEMTIQPMVLEGLPATGKVSDRSVLVKLGNALGGAYNEAAETARSRGALIRPVVARAVVRDKGGEILYRGPEVLVGADYLTEFVDSVSLSVGGDGKSTAEKLIHLPAYRLKVSADAMTGQGWIERAATLAIEVAPQFHPDTHATDSSRLVSATVGKDGNEKRLSVTIPGGSTSLNPGQPERSAKLIESVVENFEKMKMTAKTFIQPYERGVSETIVTRPYPTAANEHDCLKKAIVAEIEPVGYEQRLLVKLNSPNRFSARSYSSDGAGSILAGNIERYRFAGYQARAMAAEVSESLGFRSMTTVTFRDGSSVSSLDSGASGAPMTMNPIATYPGDDAQTVRLTISYSDGTVRTWNYALVPSRSGRFSLGIMPEIGTAEGAVADEAIGIPTKVEAVRPIRLEKALVAMETARPRTVTAVAMAEGSVNAIIGRSLSGSAWEFGRSRFVVGTVHQVVSAVIHENRQKIALNKLADCGIPWPYAMTQAPDGGVFFVEKGRVYKISGTAVAEIGSAGKRSADLDSIAFDKFTRRLIVGSSAGATSFLHLDPTESMADYLTPSLGAFSCLGVSGDRVYCSTQSGLYVFPGSDGEEEYTTDISMVVRVTTADPLRAIRRIDWPIVIDEIEGCMKIERGYMPKFRTGLLAGWHIDGEVHTTVRFPIVALSVTKAYATVEGTVTLGPDKHAYLALPE